MPRFLHHWRWLALAAILLNLAAFALRRLADTRPACGLDANAAWASVDWTSTPVSPPDVRALAARMAGHRVRYLYPFTTYIKADGFSKAYVYAPQFVAAFREANPDTKLIAWVGVPLRRTNGLGIDGTVDLTDASQRREILDFIRTELIDQAGFDGVQLNVETTFDGRQELLTFLDEARERLGPGVVLAVAGETWAPDRASIAYGDRAWSADYYAQVAARVDQVAAMVYDSRARTPEEYRAFLAGQVAGISRSMAGTDAGLLVGMSVSREESEGHHPAVEDVRNAMTGVCEGIGRLGPGDKPVSGVAMYASWEAGPLDWEEWDKWVR